MPKSYGELVRSYRVAAGLTLEELAGISGLGVRTIGDIERGRTVRPHRTSADLLARALGQESLASGSARLGRRGPEDPGDPASPDRPGSADRAVGLWLPHVIPRLLPPAVRNFTGRVSELQVLTELMDHRDVGPGTAVISAIGGTAGVGKTALALHWAHQVAAEFPDGQLYVNLRGYDPAQPVSAAIALARFLRALGVGGRDIPAGLEDRVARYRSLLVGRRMLVVLDNAASDEQVRPLLPAATGCVTVVTSRDSLAGLIARDGAIRLSLDVLPMTEAVELLLALIGQRAKADPQGAETLARQCCRLPLALRVAAELATDRTTASLGELTGELADQQRRLDLLDADGDPRTALRAVLSWSYRQLDASTARVFRAAGLHPGPDLDSHAAAALSGNTTDQADRLLKRLARAHLMDVTVAGRYGMHDLLRAYAAELAVSNDGRDEWRTALTRLLDHYLRTAAVAMDSLFPAELHRRPRMPLPAAPAMPANDPAASRTWLEAHRSSLVATAVYAADHGWPRYAWQMSATLYQYLDAGAYYAEAISIHSSACRAARRAADRVAEAEALASLGGVDARQGRFREATCRLQRALTLYRQAAERIGEAYALVSLGLVGMRQGHFRESARRLQQALVLFSQADHRGGAAYALCTLGEVDLRQGRYPQAVDHLEQALTGYRLAGDQNGEACTLINLGGLDLLQGRYRQGARYLRQALTLCRQVGDRPGEAYALGNLGEVDLRQGRYPRAARYLREALTLCRQAGDRNGEACALTDLGEASLALDRHPQAFRYFRQALALFRQTGDRNGEAQVVNALGDVFLATGEPDEARRQYTSALSLARQIGDKHQQARAYHRLGDAFRADGELTQARDHWQMALIHYADLHVPEADQVRANLGLTPPP